jgi:hypothetical protein
MTDKSETRKTHLRRFTETDIPDLVKAACVFVPMLPNYKGASVDPTRIEFLLRNNLTNDGAITVFILLNDAEELVGGIMAYCVPLLFSWELVTNDVFLYIVPEYRSILNLQKLTLAYRDWAIARRAKLIQASHTGGLHEEGMERYLKSIGFEPVGKLYHLNRLKMKPSTTQTQE